MRNRREVRKIMKGGAPQPKVMDRTVRPSELKVGFLAIVRYLNLAKKRGLLSEKGTYLVVVNCYLSNGSAISHLKLACPNIDGDFFTSKAAAKNYMDLCADCSDLGQIEPDLCRSGGFIAKRV